jgi:hypothetical protein
MAVKLTIVAFGTILKAAAEKGSAIREKSDQPGGI